MVGTKGAAKIAEDALRQGFFDLQDIVIEEFQKRTPGFNNQHVTNDDEEGNFHEHIADYEYTKELLDGWIFTEGGSLNSIAEVINIAAHAAQVEYGTADARGNITHGGGHRMIASTILHSPVRDLYAAVAGRALMVALATFNYSQRKGLLKDTSALVAGKTRSGANVIWRKGRIVVKGAPGRGATAGTIKRALENLSNSMVTMFNAGKPI